MTQQLYLETLEKNLELLDEEIADDIVEYYRNRFIEEKRYEDKTEEVIIAELGRAEDLAHRIYESYGIKKELWESARKESVDIKKAIPVLLFDVLISSWLVPLLVFTVLAGLATFITFPLIVGQLPGLLLADSILVILLIIGTYSILLLLILALTELVIVVIRGILIMNFKVLTPQNKTTTRMLKRFSLFAWMRGMKMGRNIFINLGMVGLTLVSMSFILLIRTGTDFDSLLGIEHKIERSYEEDLLSEISKREKYQVVLEIGDLDVNINHNSSTTMTIDHEYNMEDYFTYTINYENNIILIRTDTSEIDGQLFTTYDGKLTLSLPQDLVIDKIVVNMGDGDLNIMSYDLDDLEVEMGDGSVIMYEIDSLKTTITGSDIDVTIVESFFDDLIIKNNKGYITLKNINNMLNDGFILELDVPYGRVNLSDIYFKNYTIDTYQADVYLFNNNDLYDVTDINITTIEGNIYLQDIYLDFLEDE